MWYPNMFIDLNYNPEHGGYIDANGPNGPYFALGLGNYPRSMFKKLYFGGLDRKVYYVYQSINPHEEQQEINEILSDPNTKVGDYIHYSHEKGVEMAEIIRDSKGNKKVGPFKNISKKNIFWCSKETKKP